ncbi:hypothetical protein A3A67_04135 [Candidatus Peribacteria bacterium RIFCSPLOWO2_01_FULL_51_18]|nr:MAG: hypothetical protein A3C52_04015 [Candidatus Peribacteria bacterium RIFCSPHIGHO2_02_FULL_51_15]OGJ65836.1 MAG: hypothetical protein A3A67_04135 [Candidatus Peribacteria bacterium RIFCSPLOWO2_01_FULL_51_18]
MTSDNVHRRYTYDVRTHDPYAALRHPGYRWALACHIVTILAAQTQGTALGWLLYEKTKSAAALGLSGLIMFLPVLILAMPVGFFVDKRSRKHILLTGIGILTAAAFAMMFLAETDSPVSLLFLAVGLSGIGNAFLSISRPVIMRDSIPDIHAENGANWSSLSRRFSSVLGPVIAGGMIAWTGAAATAFLLAVFCYFLGFIFSSRIKTLPRPSSREPMSLHALTEGFRFIGRTPLILSATLLDLFAVLLGGASGLLPLFAKDILHVGATGLGILRAAPSLGSGIMAVILAHRPPLKRAGLSLLFAVAGYGIATIVFGISVSPALSFIALFLIGTFDAVSVTVRSTILQLFVPARFRGRVFGVNMIFIYSSNELGDFESGLVAEFFGGPFSVVLGGSAAVVLAFLFGWKWKELRELKRMKIIQEPV